MPRQQAELERELGPDVDKTFLVATLKAATYAGDPTNNVTPDFLWQFCVDTSGAHLYWASTLLSSGWKKLNN